ncbi:tubulin binding cofactor C-domain-containing protein [Gorgonomyces haynaldii]|nr:tubulin binding cofactor C-domain-containing protein [Gorgonomyces haynaldii]
MALFLRNFLFDISTAPIPTESKYEYTSLINVAGDFNRSKSKTLSIDEWTNIAKARLDLDPDQALVFYHLFQLGLNIGDQEPRKLQFLLLLYNQLFRLPFIRDTLVNGDEFPRVLLGSHNPLGSSPKDIVREESAEDMEEVLKTSSFKFSSDLAHGRHQLATYWRSTAKQWLYLIHIYFYGESTETSNMHALSGLLIQDLSELDAIFMGFCCPKDNPAFKKVAQRFTQWMNEKTAASESEIICDTNACEEMKVVDLARSLFSCMDTFRDQYTLSIEKLHHWMLYCVVMTPLTFENLQLSEHGMVNATEKCGKGPVSDQVLLARKKSQTILIHPEFITNRNLYIHRCHDCNIYVLGPVENLIITRCRNTVVYGGVVKNAAVVNYCNQLTLTVYCKQFMVGSGPTLNPHASDVTAYLHCTNRPLITVQTENQEVTQSITLGPFNMWHQGLDKELLDCGIDLTKNKWDQPLSMWSKGEVKFVDPKSFHFFQIPFDNALYVVPPPAEADPHVFDTISLQRQIYSQHLPETYQQRLKHVEQVFALVRGNINNATPHLTEDARKHLEAKFSEWLQLNGKMHQIGCLVGLAHDCQQQSA